MIVRRRVSYCRGGEKTDVFHKEDMMIYPNKLIALYAAA